MKYILLLRHAKSSHDDSSLKDYNRPLAPRGKEDALRLGKFLKEIEMLPGVVISSPAKRAKQTTESFIDSAGINRDTVLWNEDLYYGSSDDYLHAIQNAENITDMVSLVGHNPKIENSVRRLCGNGSVRMPTAALVCLEQPARKWSQISDGLASLKWLMTPKVLKRMEN